jgi:glycosyltransferase involved in cell wall biosynthesis
MNIGIDAYYLFSLENTGIGHYVLNLLVQLSKIDKQNNYFLFTPAIRNAKYAELLLKNSRFQIIQVYNFLTKSRRLWLQHPSLKKHIIKNNIKFFLGGGEYIPIFLPSKIKIGVTIHDVVFKILPDTVSLVNKFFYNTLFKICIRKANIIFTGSKTTGSEIYSYLKIDENKIIIIPDGIDITRFIPDKKIVKKNYLLFVGTLQPRKNLINLLKAFAIIHNKIKEKLIIVGASGWKNSSLNEYITSLPREIRNKIEFLGYIDNETLVRLYREAKLFALPTLHEGFGLIILEAMASGTPVLTSKVGAIPEFFSDAVAFADPLSPEDISEKILNILKSQNIQNDMIRKGLKIARNYDIKNQAEKYLAVFNKIENSI